MPACLHPPEVDELAELFRPIGGEVVALREVLGRAVVWKPV